MNAHEEVMKEIQRLKKTRQFSSARIYELYWCEGDDTLQELADKIGISKSTVFIHLKRVRQHLKNVINNPFN
jgi:DNA-binding CsgD family transcriptional regulator